MAARHNPVLGVTALLADGFVSGLVLAPILRLASRYSPGTTEIAMVMTLIVFGAGDEISVQAGDEGVRFLLISGRPLREPIAWHGPIVMNTQDQIRQALSDLRSGAFIKN